MIDKPRGHPRLDEVTSLCIKLLPDALLWDSQKKLGADLQDQAANGSVVQLNIYDVGQESSIQLGPQELPL